MVVFHVTLTSRDVCIDDESLVVERSALTLDRSHSGGLEPPLLRWSCHARVPPLCFTNWVVPLRCRRGRRLAATEQRLMCAPGIEVLAQLHGVELDGLASTEDCTSLAVSDQFHLMPILTGAPRVRGVAVEPVTACGVAARSPLPPWRGLDRRARPSRHSAAPDASLTADGTLHWYFLGSAKRHGR